MIEFGIALLSALGVVGQVATLLLVAAAVAWGVSPRARAALSESRRAVGRVGVWLAAGVALIATLGSLWFSNGAGFIPCHLCWLQRYVMYPLVAILIVVALARRWWLTAAVAVVPLVGLGISSYHVWVERNPASAPTSCTVGGGPSCSLVWFEKFGYVTIPVLAGTAFALIIALLLIAASGQKARGSVASEDQPAG